MESLESRSVSPSSFEAKICFTEVFNRHLRRLYLNEFPCVKPGSEQTKFPRQAHPVSVKELKSVKFSRSVKPSQVQTSFRKNAAESKNKEESLSFDHEELIDLLRDKRSPWYELIDWTTDAGSIRETNVIYQDKKKTRAGVDLSSIENYFTCLRFNDKNITTVDSGLKRFKNLVELVLSCNGISECDSANLPSCLEILNLSGNYLDDLSLLINKPLKRLNHLGLSYNWIENLGDHLNVNYWPSLISLDLACNQFDDLVRLVDDLSSLTNLRILLLYGNPVSLLPAYRGYVIDSFPRLFSLDDNIINKEERVRYIDMKYEDSRLINGGAEFKVQFQSLKNLLVPEQPEITEESMEVFVYKYILRFIAIKDDEAENPADDPTNDDLWRGRLKSYRTKIAQTEPFDAAESIEFNEKGLAQFKYSLENLRPLRDIFLDGTHIELVEHKIFYRAKDFDPSAVDPKKKKKDAKKEAPPPPPKNKKKKNQSNMLENFVQTDLYETVIGKFRFELNSMLDGMTSEVKKSFSGKQEVKKVEEPEETSPKRNASKNDQGKKSTSSMKDLKEQKQKPPSSNAGSRGQSSAAKKKADAQLETTEPEVEPPPFELNVKCQILSFNSLREFQAHFK